MKILHILSSSKLSGAENVVCDIISLFKGQIDMAYSSMDGDISDALIKKGITFFPSQNKLHEIQAIIDYYKPDIIHSHDIRASIQAARAAKNIPIISHIHGNHDDMKILSVKSFLYLLSSFKFSKIIAVSDSVIKDYFFSTFIKRKTIVLYNIIIKDKILKKVIEDTNNYNYDFVFLGRLAYPKNVKRVATVASMVLKKITHARFGIIGDGEDKKDMIEVFEKENVLDRVEFGGYMSNPYKVLSQAKAKLMCSIYEGTPIAALEAMFLGVPVVSTPVDGLKILIDNNKNGFISEDNEVLVNAICKLILDDNIHTTIAMKAQESIKTFTEDSHYKDSIKDIYEKAIARVR